MSQYAIVIVSKDIVPPPEQHELETAWILAEHYDCVVEFLKPLDGYKMKTADILMNGVMWEMKSPRGNSTSNTIKSQFKRSSRQSRVVVIDGRRTKLSDLHIQKQIEVKIKSISRLRKVIFITKSKKVVEFFR